MKRALVLGLTLALLTSCASMLERDYTVTSDHVENPPPQGDTAYRVETYPALTSALLSYAEEGMDTGVLRFPTTYPGNLTVDLEKARRHLLEEDPLGNYAVEDVSFHTSKIIAYYEAELNFTYKVDKAALRSMPKAASRSDLATLLGKCLDEGEERLCVYLTAYSEEEPEFFENALADAWAARYGGQGEEPGETPDPSVPPSGEPASDGETPEEEVPAQPGLEVELYPQTGGARRVAVLTFTAAESQETLGLEEGALRDG